VGRWCGAGAGAGDGDGEPAAAAALGRGGSSWEERSSGARRAVAVSRARTTRGAMVIGEAFGLGWSCSCRLLDWTGGCGGHAQL